MNKSLTDEQAEEIVLLSMHCGISEREAVLRLGYLMPGYEDIEPWDATLKIMKAREKLDKEFKKTHSQHTHQGVDHDQKR